MSSDADSSHALYQYAHAAAVTFGTVVWVPFFMVFESIHYTIYREYLSFSPRELYSQGKEDIKDAWS